MHGLAAEELTNGRTQDRTPIGRARIRCWPSALELELQALAGRVHHLSKRDGTPVTQLSGPMSELVPTVAGRPGLHTLQQRIATEDRRELRRGGVVGREPELFGDIGRYREELRRPHRSWQNRAPGGADHLSPSVPQIRITGEFVDETVVETQSLHHRKGRQMSKTNAAGLVMVAARAALLGGGLAMLLAACGGDRNGQRADSASPGSTSTGSASVGPTITIASVAPASYAGTLPCADCSGLLTTLSLWPDSVYRLRETYEGKSRTPFVRTGRWQFDGQRLTLEGDTGVVGRWSLSHGDTLRMLDQAGQAIDSPLPMHLIRTDALDAVSDLGRFVGTFVYWADAPTFRECATGQTVPVVMKGDYKALERAYTAAKLPTGSGQQVEVRGRFLPRPADQEGSTRDVFEVTQYVGPSANGNCR